MKFIYQELPEDGAFITAQIGGNEVVYSVVLTKARNPLSREAVEGHFMGELSKRYYYSFWNTIRGATDSNCATHRHSCEKDGTMFRAGIFGQ